MDLDKLQKKLIAAARANPPGDAVPYAFERRIMARLATRPVADTWALWAPALWRATAPCIAVMVLLGAWSFCIPDQTASTGDFAQDIEHTLVAAADIEQSPDSLW
jgi:hypothetical protein